MPYAQYRQWEYHFWGDEGFLKSLLLATAVGYVAACCVTFRIRPRDLPRWLRPGWRTTGKLLLLGVFIAAFAAALLEPASSRFRRRVHEGMTAQQVIDRVGEPQRKLRMTPRDFYGREPCGSPPLMARGLAEDQPFDTWSYRLSDGTMDVYFRPSDNTVGELEFWPKYVVY